MVDKTNPTSPNDPTQPTGYHLKVPASFEKAGFTEQDYKKFYDNTVKLISKEMDKVTNEAIKRLKEQRQKIESGED